MLELQTQLTCLRTKLQEKTFNLLLALPSFLAPISGIMITVGLLIIADTVIGIWKAKRLGESITSRKLSQIASKMFLYQSTIVLFFLIDKFIIGDIIGAMFSVPFLLTKVVALTLASVEVFSIDENYRAVKGSSLWIAFKKLTARSKEISADIKEIKQGKTQTPNESEIDKI